MTVTYSNIWSTKILDIIEGVLISEFKGILKVGTYDVDNVSNYIKLIPVSSELVSADAIQETRKYNINFIYKYVDRHAKSTTLTHVLKYVSRIEALMHDNITNTYFNGMITHTEITAIEDGYEVVFNFSCYYTGNIN